MNDKAPYSEFTFSCPPDCSVYSSDVHKHELNSSSLEFPIVFKSSLDQDPFAINPIPSEYEQVNSFMSTTGAGCLVAGQITAYATLTLSAQYRTHVFLVLIIKNIARLIRWDRGGAIVTAPIHYDNEPFLLDFLIRYGNANREARGHDVTVDTPTDDEEMPEC
jgi:hypothetical protein